MSTNVADLAFVEAANDIVVRMYTSTGASSTYDFTGITDIDFSKPDGVLFVYPNDVNTHAKVFVPYSNIQQIFQVV